jgi:hypothetical protein
VGNFLQHAARKRDDPAARCNVLCSLSQHQERTAQVSGDDFLEEIDIILADRRKGLIPALWTNINAAEFGDGFREEPFNITRYRHVSLN